MLRLPLILVGLLFASVTLAQEFHTPADIVRIMDKSKHEIAREHPEWLEGDRRLYVMSGTSQSAASATGAVALLLQSKPWLMPDEVKCQLMSSAHPAVDDDGVLAGQR